MSKEKSIIASVQKSSFALLAILLAALVVGLLVNLTYLGAKSATDKNYVRTANDLRVYSQLLAVSAAKAYAGNKTAFSELETNYANFESSWQKLKPNVSSSQLSRLTPIWNRLSQHISILMSHHAALVSIHDSIAKLRTPIEKLREISQDTLVSLQQSQSDIRLINQLQQEALFLESIQHDLNGLLSDFSVIDNTSKSLTKKYQELNNIVVLLLRRGVLPDAAQKILSKGKPLFSELNSNLAEIAEIAPKLVELQKIDEKIFTASQELLSGTSELALSIEQETDRGSIYNILNYIIGTAIILVIIAFSYLVIQSTRKRLEITATENSANQEAILQLLDEIADLADGDLTVNATVTEAFTGAIADSINYSIEQLRELVRTINNTSEQIALTTDSCQGLAMNVAEAAEHQAGEIAGVSEAISEMASSIDRVSATALESENVAKRSVEIAHNGNKVVHNTIMGMDSIREQIQDTAKRIKRLGESSQEIGDIVSLIDDIAEQTNILALNAAIQASMAGDAGRGFAVVADEVQRLAERSSAATKQIETLVRAIQTDTNEAVISMEQTTSEVVHGARLAENAGVSLEEIENVSQALAKLIQTISNAARQQSSTASHISKTMDVIQEITLQTSTGSTETAVTISRLTNLAKDMQTSVSGFKLPNY